MSVNVVLASGTVQNRAIRYDEQARPELRFTLAQQESATDGKSWTLWLPCCAVGSAAERLAEALEDGMAIVLTSAKLCYRKRTTKAGEVSRLEVLVWSVERLRTEGEHEHSPAYQSEGSETLAEPDASQAVRSPRRCPYPKPALKGGFQN